MRQTNETERGTIAVVLEANIDEREPAADELR